MTELHEVLAVQVTAWRETGYAHADYPAIGEILSYATEGEGESSHLRYLRAAQFRALEAYWFLRLVKGTPHIVDLYRESFPSTTDRLAALG